MKSLFIFLVSTLVLSPNMLWGQEKCGTVQFNLKLNSKQSDPIRKDHFEQWLKEKIHQKALVQQANGSGQSQVDVLKIPVVVHIIHSGESKGDGRNIPNQQVYSQMTTLNEDYSQMNADRVDTPAEFSSVSANVKIEFVLAQRDPEGLPTTGIVRVKGAQSQYSFDEAELVTANSYWPAEDYLNIWVFDIASNYLGFAKFPISNLPGLDDDPNLNREVDGAFIDYRYFGTGNNAADFSKGRTVTHEVGHWLGLRHIWGDGGCTVDDFCEDTPAQSGSSSGCPAVGKNTCKEDARNDMFQNFMDYTDDVCMNVFTTCQGGRMHAVMGSSPRRKSLLQSLGGVTPVLVANDLGIRSIQSPGYGNCGSTMVPELEIRNYGTNEITSFKIDFLIDEIVKESLTLDQTLEPLDIAFITFSTIDLNAEIEQMSFKITSVNNTADGNSENNYQSVSTYFPLPKGMPYRENFTDFATDSMGDWSIKNDHGNLSAWDFAQAPNTDPDNKSAVLTYFAAPDEVFGELDYLISPVFDFTTQSTVDMTFNYAYSGIPNKYSDVFKVVISTDCGQSFPQENIVFEKIGTPLQTASQRDTAFVPSGALDWKSIELNLSDYVNFPEVVIAFVGSNGTGNNLYLDDVEIFSKSQFDYDLELYSIEELELVTCKDSFSPKVKLRNLGKIVLTDFELKYEVGGHAFSRNVSGLNLSPGEFYEVDIDFDVSQIGQYTLKVALDGPNGELDQNPDNNTQQQYFQHDTTSDVIPLRQLFDQDFRSSTWNFIRSDSLYNWQYIKLEGRKDSSLLFPGFDSTHVGSENWMVSPVLDLSSLSDAALFFDISYANRLGLNDRLQILGSRNCGRTYDQLLYSKKGGELAVAQSENAWIPETEEDWKREYVNLDALVGFQQSRVAFVVTNQNGNQMYFDNIEFYVSDNEFPVEITEPIRVFPNPASDFVEVVFNFEMREKVTLSLLNLSGKLITSQVFDNALNQQYRLDNLQINNGMYVLYVYGESVNESRRVVISK